MTRLNSRTVLAAAIASSMIFAVTAGAQAHDEGRWERERWEHRHHHHEHHYEHEHRYEPAPRVVYERQPVMVMPAPVYQAPAYAQPTNPSLNFNFTVPLQ
jgi:hypothetical protein